MLEHPLAAARRPGRCRAFGLRLASILFALPLLAGCFIPYAKDETAITDAQLLFLTPGVTPRDRVIAELGQPDVIWEPVRIHVYEEGPTGAFVWIVPAGYSATVFMTTLGEDVVLIKYDEADKVEIIDRQVGPVSRSGYGDFLRGWLARVAAKGG